MGHRAYIRVIIPDDVHYFGGDTIHGVVNLNVHSPLQTRGVRFLFAAYEATRWNEDDQNNNNHTYSERRIFLSYRLDLAGPPRELRKTHVEHIDVGTYHWPFAIVLPPLTPPSCKLNFGKIEYRMNAYCDIPGESDIKYSQVVKVAGNLFDQLAYTYPTPPVIQSNEKKFRFRRGKLNMEVSMPRFHYFFGDIAPITVDIHNESKKSVDAIKVALVTKAVFAADKKTTRNVHTKYKRIYHIKIAGRTNESFDLQYTLPNDETPTTATDDWSEYLPKLVKVYHFLQVRLDIKDISVDIPITLMHLNPGLPMYVIPTPTSAKPYFGELSTTSAPSSPQVPMRENPFVDFQNLSLSPSPAVSTTASPNPFSIHKRQSWDYSQAQPVIQYPPHTKSNSFLGTTPSSPKVSSSPKFAPSSPGRAQNPFLVNPPPLSLHKQQSWDSSLPQQQQPPTANPHSTSPLRNSFSNIQPISTTSSTTTSSNTSPNRIPLNPFWPPQTTTTTTTSTITPTSTTPPSPGLRTSGSLLAQGFAHQQPPMSPLLSPPRLPLPPYASPDHTPITPRTPREPVYPILENYEYPKDTSVVLLSFGDQNLDDDESRLLN